MKNVLCSKLPDPLNILIFKNQTSFWQSSYPQEYFVLYFVMKIIISASKNLNYSINYIFSRS